MNVHCHSLTRLAHTHTHTHSIRYGILLRKSQVELVNEFVARGTMCHQMIMGAGKTTVVAPLLSLMSANKSTLVVEVVPSSLLFFSRSVMRSKFNAIVRRSVYTLQFDRFTTVSEGLRRKLTRAKSDRAVVVSTPSAVKSLYLKFVELLSDIDREDRGETVKERRGSFTLSKITRMLGFKNHNVKVTRAEERTNQIRILLDVLKMFRTGVLLLDEVDLILHPLKSELNWPLGQKLPLDFTRSRAGFGLRWQIPFHVIDAVFVGSENSVPLISSDKSREAMHVLEEIREIISSGIKKKMLQTVRFFFLFLYVSTHSLIHTHHSYTHTHTHTGTTHRASV